VKTIDRRQNIRLSRTMYQKDAILRAAFHYSDTIYFHLGADDKDFIVEYQKKNADGMFSENEFINEVLAQTVRSNIFEETKNIREIIMSRALASSLMKTPTNNLQTPQKTPFDPVSILSDWKASDA